MNKFLFGGCSYFSGNPSVSSDFKDLSLKNNDGYWVHGCASPGQSNTTILKRIYETINELSFTGSTIFCQLTYLHRIGFYHDYTDCWIDYQPEFLNPLPKKIDSSILKMDYHINFKKNKLQSFGANVIFESEEINKKLREWYDTYLTYVHNDFSAFEFLIYQIDLITAYLKERNCDILFLYWPLIDDERMISEMSKRNFLSIDNNYSMLDYTTKNNLINKSDSHLSIDGVNFMAQKLYEYSKR